MSEISVVGPPSKNSVAVSFHGLYAALSTSVKLRPPSAMSFSALRKYVLVLVPL